MAMVPVSEKPTGLVAESGARIVAVAVIHASVERGVCEAAIANRSLQSQHSRIELVANVVIAISTRRPRGWVSLGIH